MMSAHSMTARWLASERLVLEPLRPEHAVELAALLDDAAVHQFIGGEPENAEELRARIERQAVGHSPDGRQRWLNWAVRARTSGDALGTMQATVTGDATESVAEVAWVIAPSHQGQGFAKEAAGLVVAWLRTRGVGRVRAHIHPGHLASMGVARSLGLLATDVVRDGETRWES